MVPTRPTILQIIPNLDTGGAELSAIEITEAIVRSGARAIVATQGGRMAGRIGDAGGELLVFPAATKNPFKILANARALRVLIVCEGVDLVHARSRAPAWSALLAARRTGIPLVTTYHGAYAEAGAAKRLYNSVMARGDRVIANSAYTARLIQGRYAVDDARIRVVHRGVDPARFDAAAVTLERVAQLRSAWGVAADRPVILQAARLTAWKGQRVLIEAAGLLKRRGRLGRAVVVLAGDDQGRSGYQRDLKALAVAQGVEQDICFVGHVDDIIGAFAVAHIAVVASTEPEAFGRAAAEAQAMGCPVIATDIGAPPETVIDAGRHGLDAATGWLVPPNDAEALSRCLETVLSLSSDVRADLGARARAHVTARFTLEAMKLATLEVYDELLGSRLAEALRQSTVSTGGRPNCSE